MPAWAVGVPLAAVIAALAHRAGALSASGAMAAAASGALVMGAGWSWGLLLIGYFVSSALLSAYRAREKAARSAGRADKSGPRDAAQVFANGGLFVVMALGYWAAPSPWWQALGAGAIAASAGDTWATEIGSLSPGAPRSILSWQPVGVGTSGGVTLLGLLAGGAGAAFVALLVTMIGWPRSAAIAAIAGGITGCLLDSALGASWQERRWCDACAQATEARLHRCGSATTHAGGLGWLDNDRVNAVATLGGALLGGAAAGASYL